MTIKNGQLANETNLNSAFVSKSSDSSMVGKLNLNSAEPESGAPVSNVQAEINTLKTFKAAAETTLTDHTLDIGILKGKANVIKEVPPTEEDDSSLGYGAGMIWYDSVADTYYFCISALEGAAVWKEIKTGGGGSGGINHITNSDFEEGAEGYSAYLNAPGVEPVTGTGGAPTVTIEPSEVSPLRGSVSGLFTKDAANRQGEGFSTDFTIDPADKSKPLLISFDYSTSENYKDGDIRVYIYDVTNSRIIEPSQRDLAASANHTYSAFFQASPDSVNYRLIWHVSTDDSTRSWNVKVDDIKVAPKGASVKGQVILQQRLYRATTVRDVTGDVNYTGALTSDVGSSLLSYNSATGVFTALKKVNIQANLSALSKTISSILIAITPSITGTGVAQNSDGDSGGWVTASANFVLNAGDTFRFRNVVGTSSTDSFNVLATYVSDNVVLSEDAGNREVVAKYRRTTSQAISADVTTIAQVDTLVKDTANAVTTGASWKFTAPEYGEYDLSGTLAYAASGFNGSTNRFFIQYYRNGAADPVPNLVADNPQSTANNTRYLSFSRTITLNKNDYIDIRVVSNVAVSISSIEVSIAKRSSPQTIAASETVAVRARTSGQNIPAATTTTVIYNSEVFDTHGAYNSATGAFVPPSSGYYLVTASSRYVASSWAVGNVYALSVFNNTALKEDVHAVETTSSVQRSNTITLLTYLRQGQPMLIQAYHNKSAAISLDNDPRYNSLEIIKVGN